MKTILLFWLLVSGLTATAQESTSRRRSCFADREVAAPDHRPELQQQAQQRSVYLADVLELSWAQQLQLHRPTYEALQELQWLNDATGPSTAAATDAVLDHYHHRLLRVLSPRQYAGLLRLDRTRPGLPRTATAWR